ncbi:MAG: phosphotransferase [Solirubrobacteraceae bacterium]
MDLVVVGSPGRTALKRAHAALRPGGELYCELRFPRPGGVSRARRLVSRAGFDDVRVHWPGPRAARTEPQFWLPLDSLAAAQYLLAERSPRGRRGALMRRLWVLAARAGALSPLCIVARRSQPTVGAVDAVDELTSMSEGAPPRPPSVAEPQHRSWLLMTGGQRSINKVVGLPFHNASGAPEVVVKFARVLESEPSLTREAYVLRMLEQERPAVHGIPRVLGTARRAGALALVETAVHGSALMSALTPATFPPLAALVTRWLVELAGSSERHARSDWWTRLVAEPLEMFERQFGSVVGDGVITKAHERLSALQSLPVAFEHRDCSPWNIVLTRRGAPGLLDWESAEPRGLPALDLIYFLTTSAFVLDAALDQGTTREAYARLLDSSTASGRVAADCLASYCRELDLDPAVSSPLRLLTWIVHSRSDFRHVQMDTAALPTQASLRDSVFVGLVQEELRRDA